MLAPLNFTLKQPLSLLGHANTYKQQTDAQYKTFHVFNMANSRNNDIRLSKQCKLYEFFSCDDTSVMVKQPLSLRGHANAYKKTDRCAIQGISRI